MSYELLYRSFAIGYKEGFNLFICTSDTYLENHLRGILHEYSSLANGPKKRGSIGLVKTSSAYSRKLSF